MGGLGPGRGSVCYAGDEAWGGCGWWRAYEPMSQMKARSEATKVIIPQRGQSTQAKCRH